MKMFFDSFETPLGKMTAVFYGRSLCYLDYTEFEDRMNRLLARRFGTYDMTREENLFDIRGRVNRYFKKDWNAFDGLVLEVRGTKFQKTVWDSLTRITCGQTLSYSAQAKILNKASAVRAVASANRVNPLTIIIPCHRVIGKNGKLTGYAGGLERKEWLLRHEGAI